MDLTARYTLKLRIITTVNFNGYELYPQAIYWELPTNEYALRTQQRLVFFLLFFCQ